MHKRFRTQFHAGFVSAVIALGSCSEPSAPVRVASVEISPGATSLLFGPGGGQAVQLWAKARSASGEELARPITWSTQNAAVVFVSPTGFVTALGVGTTIVRATAEERTATVTITVLPVPIANISITSAAVALLRTPLSIGTAQVVAVARDSTGAELTNRPFVWSSSNDVVASVNAFGQVSAIGAGSAFVIASANGLRDSVAVTVAVDDALPAGFDVAITGALWTQGSQTVEGNIPMILGGRDAVLNVMTSSPQALAVSGSFELRLVGVDGGLRWSTRRSAIVPAGSSTAASPTLQFLVPSEELSIDLQWEVLWDPNDEIPDADATTDRFPRLGRDALVAVQPAPLKLRFVPVSLTVHGGATGNVNTNNVEEYLRLVRQFGPVGGIEYSIAPPFPIDVSFGVAPTGGGSPFWVSVLQQLDAARVSSPEFADAHWVGIVAPPAGFNYATFGGYGYIPANGSSFGPGTRTFALVNAFWFTRESQSRELMMHELGHNLGRRHAPCGGASAPDGSFPDALGHVGSGGHDTYSFARQFTTSANAIPSNRGDTMGYCSPVWISTYSYDAMLQFRGSAMVAAAEQPQPQRALVVYGLADDAGSATLSRAIRMEAVADIAPDAGDWEAFVYDDAGALLARRRFELGKLDHLADLRPISVAIPLGGLDAARVKRIEVRSASGRTSAIDAQHGAP